MKFTQYVMNFVLLETDRLLLKGLLPEDFQSIFDRFSKPEIKKILGHRNEDDFLKEEAKIKNGYATYNRSFLLFLMEHKPSQQIIGRCGLHNWNKDHQRAELGYVMQEDMYKQQGLMSEAVEAILSYGFEQLKLHRIEALVGTSNVASQKILSKFGFVKEGTLRQHYAVGDQFADSDVFSKLAHDFFAEKELSNT